MARTVDDCERINVIESTTVDSTSQENPTLKIQIPKLEGVSFNFESKTQVKEYNTMYIIQVSYLSKTSVCRFKSQSYLSPSSGISIVWRADSWRRRNATPQLSALPNDGDAARWR